MYILKNALRCITRSKGRNVLIGIITLVISISACIGLSIRQAAENAKISALEEMSVTATISYNRAGAMEQMGGGRGQSGEKPSFDKSQFAEMMGDTVLLTIDDYKIYAAAPSVQNFYYTITVYFNGSDALSPVSEETENENQSSPPGFHGGSGFNREITGDFSVIGYSSDASMNDFINGIAAIKEGGTMFTEGTEEYVCVISEELAIYNGLSVGDSIVITNPSLETETFVLTVSGIYTSSENNDFSMSAFGFSQDPANRIYMSANALQKIISESEAASTTVTDSEGRQTESKLTGNINATYCFADVDSYYAFTEEVRTLGLNESYTVSSADIAEFERSLTPLKTLSTMAGWFLLVILIIGGIILVVLNIFSVRERKYEVGVLTAMGMKKWKVACQFICETLIIAMTSVVIGACIGAASSVPVTNSLLAEQIESQSNQQTQMNQGFGRPGNMSGSMSGEGMGGTPPDIPSDNQGGGRNPFENMMGNAANYITEVDSAMNLTVVFQMLGVGILLTLIAGFSSVLFIMRYDPLKILANRD